MTAETNQDARRRVVPMQPVDAPTDVLPAVGGPGPSRPVRPPFPTPGPAGPPRPPASSAASVPPMPPVPPGPPRPAAPAADPASSSGTSSSGTSSSQGSSSESAEEPERRFGMGMPALVLGLLAAGTAWSGWAGVVLGLFAAAAGFLGTRRAWRGLATDGAYSLGGLVLGAVGLVWGAVVVSQTLFGGGAFGDGLTLDQCLSQATSSFEMHMCKSQHITEFNQRFPDAAE